MKEFDFYYGEHDAISFSKIKPEKFLDYLESAIALTKNNIEAFKAQTWQGEEALSALEDLAVPVHIVQGLFIHYSLTAAGEEIHQASQTFSQKASEIYNLIGQDQEIFAVLSVLYEERAQYSQEKQRVIEKMYLSAKHSGAMLENDAKGLFNDTDQKLSALQLKFSENNLKATKNCSLVLDKKELGGLSPSFISILEENAREKNQEGYLFELNYPSYLAVMTQSTCRELRERIYLANGTKTTQGEHDNRNLITEILKLRYQKVQQLGYSSYCDYVFTQRMAKDSEEVLAFLDDLYHRAYQRGTQEFAELSAFAKEHGHEGGLQAWDILFWAEKLKEKKFNLDEEKLRAYFELEHVLEHGIFDFCRKLYQVTFEKIELETVRENITTYAVYDEGKYCGLLYLDLFVHPEKNAGAWVFDLRNRGRVKGKDFAPAIYLACNFLKSKTGPTLLTFDEVKTLFHELGHALHGLLTKVNHPSIAGTNVQWDFVELPSQMTEKWLFQKEFLSGLGKHYETGASLPEEWVTTLQEMPKFHSGFLYLRQLKFARSDIHLHADINNIPQDLAAFEKKVEEEHTLTPHVPQVHFLTAFNHVFASAGYASGYYSYLWANIMDADAFSLFQEKGILNRETAQSFKDHILQKGDSEDPRDLFKKFRGRDANPQAFLRFAGLE